MQIGDLIPIGAVGNAQKVDVLAGKTFSSETEGVEVVGTMPNNGVKIITPSTADQALEGYYASGSKVKSGYGVGSIIPYSAFGLTKPIISAANAMERGVQYESPRTIMLSNGNIVSTLSNKTYFLLYNSETLVATRYDIKDESDVAPSSIYIHDSDSNNNIYLNGGDGLWKITSDFSFISKYITAGSGITLASTAVDPATGEVYFCSYDGTYYYINKLSADFTELAYSVKTPNGKAVALKYDTYSSHLFAYDGYSEILYKIDPTTGGSVSSRSNVRNFLGVKNGYVYTTYRGSNDWYGLCKIPVNSLGTTTWTYQEKYNEAGSLAVDSADNVYVSVGNRIIKLSSNSGVIYEWTLLGSSRGGNISFIDVYEGEGLNDIYATVRAHTPSTNEIDLTLIRISNNLKLSSVI